MAENSNYIGVAMGLDVTDLKAGLTEANAQIAMANAEFKSASSVMDNWATSIEGVSAKVEQLDKVLGLQKSKLAGLQAEYDEIVKSQGENSEAAKSLRLAMLKQEAVVNKTEKEYNNFKQTLEDAEAGIIDLEKVSLRGGKVVEKMGEQAEASGEGFTVMKGAIASLLAEGVKALASGVLELGKSFFGLAESTREFREDQAKLNSAFETADLSAKSAEETYRKLFGAIGEEDTAVEAAQQIALLAKSEEDVAKWADLATSVVATFGDALKPETFYEAANETLNLGEATGAFTQMLEQTGYSVDTFNDGLAKCTTEEEKQAYMLDITNKLIGEAGKAYEENAGDIIKAREAQAEMTQALADYGAIVEPIMTEMKTLATELLETVKPFVELIAGGMMDALNGTSGAAEKLAEGIGGLIDVLVDRFMNLVPTVLELILQLLPQIANTILESLPQLVGVITQLTTSVLDMLGELLPEIVIKIVEIIPLLIEQLVAAIPQVLEAFVTLLQSCVEALPIIIEKLLAALPSLLDAICSMLIESMPLLLEAAIQLFNSIIDALPVIIEALLLNLPLLVQTIIDFLIQSLPLLLDGAIELLMAIIHALPVIINLLVVEVPKIVDSIVGTLLDNIDVLTEGALELFFGILAAIPDLITEIWVQMPDIITSMVDALLGGLLDMKGVGGDLIQGVIDGMLDFDFLDALDNIGDAIVGAFEKIFDINSPSKVMAGLGEFLGEGVGVGMLDSLPEVKKNLGDFSDAIQDGIDVNTSGIRKSSAKSRGGTVIDARMTVNYNGHLSRKELKQIERDNYTAVYTTLKKQGAV